ncbi:hypothetical protein D3C72_1410860 [compost metagenome]
MGVESIIIGAELVRGIHLIRNVFQQFLVHVFREGFGDIDIAGQVAFSGVRFLVDWYKGHLGQNGMRMIPIVFVGRQHQFLVDHTLL